MVCNKYSLPYSACTVLLDSIAKTIIFCAEKKFCTALHGLQ